LKVSYKLLFLNAFFLVLAAGCAALPSLPEVPDTFALKGKVAVRDGIDQFSANILWHQHAEGFEIDLWGPLGQGRVRLMKQGEELLLRNGQDEVLTQGDPETVMRENLGWSLPVDVLPAWVQGHPLTAVAAEELGYDEAGRVTSFRQLGWVVQLDRYETQGGASDRRDLPTRVTAQKDQYRLRLVISEWEI